MQCEYKLEGDMEGEKHETGEVTGYRIGERLDPPVISFEAPPWCNVDSVYEYCKRGLYGYEPSR